MNEEDFLRALFLAMKNGLIPEDFRRAHVGTQRYCDFDVEGTADHWLWRGRDWGNEPMAFRVDPKAARFYDMAETYYQELPKVEFTGVSPLVASFLYGVTLEYPEGGLFVGTPSRGLVGPRPVMMYFPAVPEPPDPLWGQAVLDMGDDALRKIGLTPTLRRRFVRDVQAYVDDVALRAILLHKLDHSAPRQPIDIANMVQWFIHHPQWDQLRQDAAIRNQLYHAIKDDSRLSAAELEQFKMMLESLSRPHGEH